jgi:hypothetical protein
MSLAFGAFVGIDGIDIAAHANRLVWAFKFAGTASCALLGDNFVGHGLVFLKIREDYIAYPLFEATGGHLF